MDPIRASGSERVEVAALRWTRIELTVQYQIMHSQVQADSDGANWLVQRASRHLPTRASSRLTTLRHQRRQRDCDRTDTTRLGIGLLDDRHQ